MIALPKICYSFVNGQYVTSHGRLVENIYPATNKPINTISYASDQDIEAAVDRAHEAFLIWSKTPIAVRSDILCRAAAMLRQRVKELAEVEVWDTGKPISEALNVDVVTAAETLDYFAKTALAFEDSVIPNHGALIYTSREPLGVCAAIGAWNYPLQIACWKLAPALMMGNAMVYKPSELTPMTSLMLAEILLEAGLPKGVFNVVLGDGEVAQKLLSSDGIAKVSFTGSVQTGKKIAEAAAKNLLPVTLELGGKSPLIIFDDTDIDQAIVGTMLANFYTQGEICSNGTRVFIQKNIYNNFIEQLQQRVDKLIIGNPFDRKTQVGALISKNHLDKVMHYIEEGRKSGATLVCGGARELTPPLEKGNFVKPTIFTDCSDDMSIVKDEIFGPVMCALPFDTEAEVVGRANQTRYGLAAGVFTNDIKRAHRVAKQLQAGVCWINNYNVTPVAMPFGGYKHSGIGRENGFVTLSQYTQVKSVYVELNEIEHSYV